MGPDPSIEASLLSFVNDQGMNVPIIDRCMIIIGRMLYLSPPRGWPTHSATAKERGDSEQRSAALNSALGNISQLKRAETGGDALRHCHRRGQHRKRAMELEER